MLGRLAALRQREDNVPFQRAETIISAADPGCDNPAEAALLWVIKSVSAFDVVTQHEIVINGRRYFADIAIPELMIIFEFDGIGKLGTNEADYEDLARLRAWVIERVGLRQSSIPASAQGLWVKPTKACDGPDRRFHVTWSQWDAREQRAR